MWFKRKPKPAPQPEVFVSINHETGLPDLPPGYRWFVSEGRGVYYPYGRTPLNVRLSIQKRQDDIYEGTLEGYVIVKEWWLDTPSDTYIEKESLNAERLRESAVRLLKRPETQITLGLRAPDPSWSDYLGAYPPKSISN